jgi:hypothetical protein
MSTSNMVYRPCSTTVRPRYGAAMDDVSSSPPVGASVWDRQMWTYLTEHMKREGAMLQEYVSISEGTESRALSYLVNLLVEDERRHHAFFEALASSLKSEAELSGVEPEIPRLDLNKVNRAELVDMTRRLLEHEQSDAAELKRLHRELRDVQETTLWGLLVEIMQRDTDKHIAILRFVADHS